MKKTQSYFEKIASTLAYPTHAFINGKFVPSLSGKTMDTVNPATGRVFASFASCGAEDIELAVAAARRVFGSGVWSKMHPSGRKKILLRFADLIENNLEALATLEAVDSGKPVSECVGTDLPESLATLRWHAEFPDKCYGKISPSGSTGFYIPPTIFIAPKPGASLLTDEIFGPVTCIIGAESNEEAIRIANDTEYGLQATLFTGSLRHAHNCARALKAGTISVNKYCEGDPSTPFGGWKLSGFGGQDKAAQAHDQYCEIKTIFIDLGR